VTADGGGSARMLVVTGLRAAYDRLEVLHGIDLHVDRSEILAVIGANGAGKTTLLRAVSGLIAPTAGTVEVAGREVTGLTAERVAAAGLAHVPENRLVFPGLSVDDNQGSVLLQPQRRLQTGRCSGYGGVAPAG